MYLYSIIASMKNPTPNDLETFRIRFELTDSQLPILHVLSFDINQRNDDPPEYVEVARWWEENKASEGIR